MIRDLVPHRSARAMVRLLALAMLATVCMAAVGVCGAFCVQTSTAGAAGSADEAVLVVSDEGVATPSRAVRRTRCRVRQRRRPTTGSVHVATWRRAAPAPVVRRVGAAATARRGPPALALRSS